MTIRLINESTLIINKFNLNETGNSNFILYTYPILILIILGSDLLVEGLWTLGSLSEVYIYLIY